LSSVVAGAKVNKKEAFRNLAAYVNKKTESNWDAESAESRFKAYLKTYKETVKRYLDVSGPKFTLTDKDFKKGLLLS